MEIYSDLSEAISRVTGAPALPPLWSGVKEFAARFGYSHLHAVDAARIVGGVSGAIMYSDAPSELLASIDREFVYQHHPVVQRVLTSPVPFLISDMRNDPRHAGQRWSELMADVVRRGDGLVVPVYNGDDPKAGFNFAGEQPDTSAVVRSMLQVIAHAAVDRAFELRDGVSQSGVRLSVRETQCLRAVATGQTDAEIGTALGISPRTVRFHVDSAKGKLSVTTRIQAVAKALRERIIAA